MANRVICIVFPFADGSVAQGSDNDDKRALRDLRASISAAYDGRPTNTSFGDQRGSTPGGDPVTGYSITMGIDKAETSWFKTEFWGGGEDSFVELVPGVGYNVKAEARAPFFTLDRADRTASVKEICETLGVPFVEASSTRKARTPKVTDPYGTVGDVLALCNASIEGFDAVAHLQTPRAELVAMYEASLPTETEDETPATDSAE